MSRRATLTTILTAMLLVAVPYTVLATDSDGDGTDDATMIFRPTRVRTRTPTGMVCLTP